MGLHHDDVPEAAGGHPGAFLELDKTREAAYMREHGYRFRAIARASRFVRATARSRHRQAVVQPGAC